MKQSIWLILIFCCYNFATAQNKPKEIFKANLCIVERYLKEQKMEGTKLDDSILFLEEITDIKSDIYPGFTVTYQPTDQNLKDWKDWFKKNKNRLYWDEKEQKVKVKK